MTRHLYLDHLSILHPDAENIALYLSGKRSFNKFESEFGIRHNILFLHAFELQIELMELNPNRVEKIKSLDYPSYLNTREWKLKSWIIRNFYEYRCTACGGGPITDVHHNTYMNKPLERFIDLTLLCRACHEKFHFPIKEKTKNKFGAAWLGDVETEYEIRDWRRDSLENRIQECEAILQKTPGNDEVQREYRELLLRRGLLPNRVTT